MISKRRRKIPWYRKIFYALVPTAFLFALLELGLTWFGVEPILQARDPFVGFSSQVPLFQSERGADGTTWMVTSPTKLVWFNHQAFPASKAKGTKRVFCVGGSTTYGRPYDDSTSYSGWLRALLPKLDDTSQWEVINAGGVSYASYRVAKVMEELATYEPDLFIVYSVHNEFLERRTYAAMFERPQFLTMAESQVGRLRTYAVIDRWLRRLQLSAIHEVEQGRGWTEFLPAEVDERLNHTIGPTDYHRDPEWRARVLAHYRFNLKRMVAIARQAGADIVFVTPASNESACSPFKSEFPDGMSEGNKAAFQLAMKAWQDDEAEDSDAARLAIEAALRIDPLHAEAHYRLGRTLTKLGQYEDAHQSFIRALDLDICPLRAVSEISQALRDVALELQVPLVDFEQLLHEKSLRELGTPSLGETYFLDHVHPTMDVHRQLAVWIVDTLQKNQLVSGQGVSTPEAQATIDAIQVEMISQIDQQAHGVALRNLAKVLHWSGKYAEASPRASDALEMLPNDLESRFVLADCLANLGDTEAAKTQYEILFEDGDFARAYLPFADILFAGQEYERARDFALLAILAKPENAYAYFLLGKAHLELEEHAFAVEAFTKALALAPGNATTLELLERSRNAVEAN